jgi:hypothetical protein
MDSHAPSLRRSVRFFLAQTRGFHRVGPCGRSLKMPSIPPNVSKKADSFSFLFWVGIRLLFAIG